MHNFKFNYLSRGQLVSLNLDKIFLLLLKILPRYEAFFGNLIFAIIARMLCGNHLNLFQKQLKKVPGIQLHCTSFHNHFVPPNSHFVPIKNSHFVSIKNSHFVSSIRLACDLTCFKLSTNFQRRNRLRSKNSLQNSP